MAVRHGHTDTAEALLDRAADVNLARRNGAAPLFIACQNAHSEVALLLLDRDADVDQVALNPTPNLIETNRDAPLAGEDTGWRNSPIHHLR